MVVQQGALEGRGGAKAVEDELLLVLMFSQTENRVCARENSWFELHWFVFRPSPLFEHKVSESVSGVTELMSQSVGESLS